MWILVRILELLFRLPACIHRALASRLTQHKRQVNARKASWSRTQW